MQLDLSVHHSTAKPRKLLKNDGTVVTQVVKTFVALLRSWRKRMSHSRTARPLDHQVVLERERHSGD